MADLRFKEAVLYLCEPLDVGAQDRPLKNKVGELAVTDDPDQSSRLQLLHMMRQGGGAHAMDLMQPGAGRRVLARADLFEDLQTSRLSQGARDPRELPVCQSGNFHHEWVEA